MYEISGTRRTHEEARNIYRTFTGKSKIEKPLGIYGRC
jgi:hypothetical protein